MKRLKIAWLKFMARRYYYAYLISLDSYSCGASVAKMMPRHATIRNKFNRCLDRLAELDENTPTARL